MREVEGDLCIQMKMARPHRFGVVPDQNTRLFAAHPVSYILAYTACDPAEFPGPDLAIQTHSNELVDLSTLSLGSTAI